MNEREAIIEVRMARYNYELADFEPSTGHLHGCSEVDCACIHHLFAVAQDAEIHDAALEAQARSDALAPVLALADDWEANGNSRELGDPTDRVWFKCATELRAALASDPTHTQNGAQA